MMEMLQMMEMMERRKEEGTSGERHRKDKLSLFTWQRWNTSFKEKKLFSLQILPKSSSCFQLQTRSSSLS